MFISWYNKDFLRVDQIIQYTFICNNRSVWYNSFKGDGWNIFLYMLFFYIQLLTANHIEPFLPRDHPIVYGTVQLLIFTSVRWALYKNKSRPFVTFEWAESWCCFINVKRNHEEIFYRLFVRVFPRLLNFPKSWYTLLHNSRILLYDEWCHYESAYFRLWSTLSEMSHPPCHVGLLFPDSLHFKFRRFNPVFNTYHILYNINTCIFQIPLHAVWKPSLTKCL